MITTLISLFLATQTQAKLELHPMVSGAIQKVGFYFSQKLILTKKQPSGFKNVPAKAVLFGSFKFAGKVFPAAELYEKGKPASLVIDFTATGNFSKARPAVWSKRPMDPQKPNGPMFYTTDLNAPSLVGGDKRVQINFYRFDPTVGPPSMSGQLMYYGNYALDGTLTIGSKTYHAMLVDLQTKGTFTDRGKGMAVFGLYTLMVDLNGDGQFQSPAETFDATKPFTIDGMTLQITGLGDDLSKIGITTKGK